MRTILRADQVAVSEREEFMRDAVGALIGPLEVRTDHDLAVPDRLTVGALGSVGVAELAASRRGAAERTSRHARDVDPELCKVDVVAAGRAVVEQDGRQATLGPGDLTFVDLRRPASWANGDATRIVAITFPRAQLSFGRELADLTGVRIAGDRGAGALVGALAPQLVHRLDEFGAGDGARLGTAAFDLVTSALAGRLDLPDAAAADSRERALLLSIHAYVESHLSDPALAPPAVAAAHALSLRALHQLFESQPTTVAALIRTRRLERIRRDLAAPSLRRVPVSAIAARWGITNPAHFSRLFRAAYGLSPTDYRAAVRAGAAGLTPDGPAATGG
jgi:AraC-like DNA-binding protein